MSSVYLSGPMTGLENFNRDLFSYYAKVWEDKGYIVFNPGSQEGHGYLDCLPQDMSWVAEADLIAVLPEWYRSKGALLEVMYAVLLDKEIVFAENGAPLSPMVLETTMLGLHLRPN